MAIDPVAAVGTELALDGRDRTHGDEEEPVVAERAVPRDGRLDEVADAVQLVAPRQVAVGRRRLSDLDERVEVAIGPLGRLDERDRLVGHRARAPASRARPNSQPAASSHL